MVSFSPQHFCSTEADHSDVKVIPSQFEHWYRQGEDWLNQLQFGQALECFEAALDLYPDHQQARLYQVNCLLHLHRYGEALVLCDQLLAGSAAPAKAWMLKGVALQRLRRYREAYAAFARATV